MQWTGPGSGARDQIISFKWLTRGGPGATQFITDAAVYRSAGYPGSNLRGVTVSYALRDADIQTEFGADVILTDTDNGVIEDLCFPCGVIDSNVFYADSPWQKQLVPVVLFGRVESVYCSGGAATDQTLLILGSTTLGGVCSNFSAVEFTAKRRLGGFSTSGVVAGAFNMTGDSAGIDWTNAEGAPYYDTSASTGLSSAGAPLNVPNAGRGIVGICKFGAPLTTAYPRAAPYLAVSPVRRQAIVMCMQTSVGRV